MVWRAADLGLVDWVCASARYGHDVEFRMCCEQLSVPYVVAIRRTTHIYNYVVDRPLSVPAELFQKKGKWSCCSSNSLCESAHSHEWAIDKWKPEYGSEFQSGFLARRSSGYLSGIEFFYFRVHKQNTPEEVIWIASHIGAVRECIANASMRAGLDDYEVRSWAGWHRHVTLSMVASAALAIVQSRTRRSDT